MARKKASPKKPPSVKGTARHKAEPHRHHKAAGHAPQKSVEHAKHAHSRNQLETNMEHFGKEMGALGDRIGKHIEERHKRDGRRHESPSGQKQHEGWYHRTFGIAGPFISSVFSMVIFFIAIWLINAVNFPVGNMFMSDLAAFLLDNTGLFFLAFLLFSYSSYFSRYSPKAYRPFSPVAIAAAFTFAFWLAGSALSIANFSLANPVMFDTAYWMLRLLPAIFGSVIFIGYLVLIAKISVESSEEGKRLKDVHGHAHGHHPSSQEGDIKRLYRSGKDKILGGVCGGLGEYFHVDPVLFRLLFVILIFAWGIGILLYLVCWIVIPRNPYQKWGR